MTLDLSYAKPGQCKHGRSGWQMQADSKFSWGNFKKAFAVRANFKKSHLLTTMRMFMCVLGRF